MFVSVVTVRGILEEIQRRGIARDELLRVASLDEEQLSDMRTMVGVDVLGRVVTRAIELLRNPALGLTLGVQAPDGLGQIVAHLALSVPTLREAFALLQRYSPILVDDLHLSLSQHGARAEFRYDFHAGMELTTTRFAAEYLSAVCIRLAEQRFAPGDHALEVRYRYPAPAYRDRYEAVFHCPVLFGQSRYAIVFSTDMLDRRQVHADSAMADVLRVAAEHMLAKVGTTLSLSDRVRSLLRQKLDLCDVDTERLARELGMSHRVLRRKLSGEGASMSRLVEQARVDRARVELLRPGATIKQTAEHLGYSEPSAFHRAFKRWTGVTPVLFVRDQAEGRAVSRQADVAVDPGDEPGCERSDTSALRPPDT